MAPFVKKKLPAGKTLRQSFRNPLISVMVYDVVIAAVKFPAGIIRDE